MEDRAVPTTISYTTAGSVYTQNFSTLPDAGGTATISGAASSPGPFDLTQTTPTGNYGASGLSGWYGGDILSGGEKFGAGEPSTTTGALFDFNDGAAGSQALGTISTTSTDSRFGAIFTNNTGSTLTQFTLSYTGEEWWANSGSGTSMEFSYEDLGTSNSALPLGTSGYTTVSQLGFTGPITQSSGTYENGTLPANQVNVSSYTVTGLTWLNGENFAIFWDKGTTGAGSSDGLGVANVQFSATTGSSPPSFSGPTTTNVLGGLGSAEVQTFSGVAASGGPTFSLINSPPSWVTINASTGVLSFGQNATTPTESTTTSFNITIQAQNSAGTVTEGFTINVTPTVSYATAGNSSTQNFGTLPDAGGNNTTTNAPSQGPFDLTVASPSGFGASGLSGWYGTNLLPSVEKFDAGEPYATTGTLYDFNDGSSGSQSLGTISTTSTDSRFGEIFVNNTGSTLSQFNLSYTGEEWWDNIGTGTALNFSYQLGAISGYAGLNTGSSGYTGVSGLGFTAPDSSQSGAYEDAHTNTAYQVPVSGNVSGINWLPGTTLEIFWDKGTTGAGTSDGLGVANVQFSAIVVSSPAFSGPTTTTILGGLGSAQVQTFSGVSASGNPPPTFSLINSPPSWVTINATTGVLSFGQNAAVPAVTTTTSYNLTIQAANTGGSVTETFTVVVTPSVSYTAAGGSSTQNFSTLPTGNSAVSAAASSQGPFDLTLTTPTGNFGASGVSGWYGGNVLSSGERFGEGEPTTTTGALFDFNDGSAGTQALGTISTATTDSRFGEILVNNTGSSLNQFSLSYTGEEWWANSGAGTSLNFSYELGATSLPLGTSGYTGVGTLGFTAPVSGSGSAVDGSQSANQVSVSGTVTLSTPWAAGTTLVIFWDKGTTGASQSAGLGVANVNFSAESGLSTTTVLTSISPLTADTGSPVTFTATVTASSAPTGGAVEFIDGANNTLLATATGYTNSGNTDTFTVTSTTVPAGTFSDIQAYYTGTPGYGGSTSTVYGSTLTITAPSGAFTPGDIVVLQEGDGSTQYAKAAPLYLDEYTPSGTFVEQVAIPNNETVGGSGNQPVTLDIGDTADKNGNGTGQLSLSFDGTQLLFGGNDANANSGTFATDNRVIAVVGTNPYATGGINTATYGPFNSDDDIRQVAEYNSTTLYDVGKATPTTDGGLRYFNGLTTGGGTTGTEVSNPSGSTGGTNNNVRSVVVAFNGETFYTSAQGPAAAGVYISTVGGNPIYLPTQATSVSGAVDTQIIPDPAGTAQKINGVYVADTNSDGVLDAGDKVYFVDPTNGLYSSTFLGGSQTSTADWTTAVNLTPSLASSGLTIEGLTGQVISSTETMLFITGYDGKGNTAVYSYDDGGTNTLTTLLSGSSATDKGLTYSGVAFAPEAATSLTLSVSPTSALPGQTVTFTADVSSSNGTPTGNISFIDTASGSPVLLGEAAISAGVATFQDSSLAVGQHDIYAYYSGTSTIAPATTAAQLVSVTGSNASAVNITSNTPNPSTLGATVTLDATVTNASGNSSLAAPTGTVSFYYGTTLLGSATVSSGAATLAVTTLPLGTDTNITAVYLGDVNYKSSTSAAVSETINPGATITIGPSTSGSTTPGSNVTFTATVTGNGLSGTPNGSPTGTVEFFEDGSTSPFATGTLSGSGNTLTTTGTLTAITAGTHVITATYFPDTNSEYATTNTAAAEPAVAPYLENAIEALVPGDLVVLRRETDVSNQAGLTYLDVYNTSGSLLETVILPDVDNSATDTYAVNISDKRPQEGAVTRSPDGSTISVLGFDFPINGGDPENSATELAVANINLSGTIDTSTEVSVGAEAGLVEPRSAVDDAGTIYFNTNQTGTTTGIQEAADGSVNSAVAIGPNSSSGKDAEILGNQLYVSNSTDVIDLVGTFGGGVPTSQTTLTALPGLANDYATAGLYLPPGGTAGPNPYSFLLFNHVDGTSTDPDTLYIADQTYGLLKFYNSTETNGNPTTGTWVLTGQKLNNNNGLEGLTGYEVFNSNGSFQGFQLYATAAISTGNPGNQLLSFEDTNAYNAGGASGGGIAGGTFNVIGPGVDPTASYSGLAFAPGYGTTTTVTDSGYVANNTFTATVKSAGGNTPTGEVFFYVDGTYVGEGALNASGVATFDDTSYPQDHNAHVITAAYQGDVDDDTSTGTLTQKVPTTTSLTDDGPNPSVSGQAVSFVVSVSGGNSTFTGETVQIEDASNSNAVVGSGTLNSSGSASISISTLSVGAHNLFAVYGGDSVNSASSSSTVTQTVNANPITVSSVNVDAGTAPVITASESGTTVTITTGGTNGFSAGDPVVLSGVSSPSGYDGTYTIATVSPSTNSFTINNFPTTGLGTVSNSGTATDTALTDSGLLVNGTAGSGHSASYNSQRSMVDSIVYTFNQAVTIGSGGFTIAVHTGDSDGGTAPSLSWASPNGGTTWVVTFSGAGVVGNSIANGVYDITLNNSSVHAVSGGGTLANSETDTFYRLYGDINGDERVNSTDYAAFNPAYNSRSTGSTAAAFVAGFDANGDGRVNSTDYSAFNPDYNVRYTGFSRTI